MWTSMRRWFKQTMGAEAPFLRRRGMGASRFIEGRFTDPQGTAQFGTLRRHPELAYRLYLPSGSSPRDSLPLLVMLHGCTQNPLSFAEGTRMNALAEESRFAVLYPQQSRRSNPQRCWNWFEPASINGRGEAAMIARLIEQVALRRPIDPRRVYVAGMSAGGSMACILALLHSRLFAACATHSGLMCGAANSPMQAMEAMRCGPSAAAVEEARRLVHRSDAAAVMVPTLVIHGDLDTRVNPVNADRIIEQLTARAEFLDPDAGALLASGERRVDSGGRSFRQQDYTQQGRLVLREIVVEGLAHAWSGGDARYEFNDAQGPDASRLILEFVMRYEREGTVIASARPR